MRYGKTAALLVAIVAIVACGDDDDSSGGNGVAERIVLGPEGNRLRAYAADDEDRQQVVIPSAADDPANGRDINGQVCIAPGGRVFIAGEDTGQPDPPAGWGVFELAGDRVGELSATQIGKLNATFQTGPGMEGSTSGAEPYGCAFLSDGRVITTDVGNQASGPPNGQVIIWFPPLDVPDPAYCKLDIAVGTPGGVYIDDADNVYVASARESSGVLLYAPPFPTSDDPTGGCDGVDSTGAPMATGVEQTRFIVADENIPTPNGIVRTRDDTFLVSSILNGVIAEYDDSGSFVRRILEPPPGETLGEMPFSTGTPFGLAIASDGTVFFSDLGLVIDSSGIGPGRNTGSVRRIRFAEGEPQPPETFLDGLAFPDGVAVLEP